MLSYFRKRPAGNDNDAHTASAPLKTFKFPSGQRKMEDHIARAKMSTGAFQYVTLSARSRVTRESLIQQLTTSRRLLKVDTDSLPTMEPIVCVARTFDLTLATQLPTKFLKAKTPWVHIAEVLAFFVPALSSTDSYSDVRLSLIDERFADDTVKRSVTSPNNIGFDARIALDYSVHVADIDKIKLRFEMLNSVLIDGVAWGSLCLSIKIGQSTTAAAFPHEDTVAVLCMPDTMLVERHTNPNHVNLVIDQADLDDLTMLEKQGRLIDHTRPVDKQERIRRLRSEYGGSDIGSDRPQEEMRPWEGPSLSLPGPSSGRPAPGRGARKSRASSRPPSSVGSRDEPPQSDDGSVHHPNTALVPGRTMQSVNEDSESSVSDSPSRGMGSPGATKNVTRNVRLVFPPDS
jgi:hypothetical protein